MTMPGGVAEGLESPEMLERAEHQAEQCDRAERAPDQACIENGGAAQHGRRMQRQHVSRAVEPCIRDRVGRGGSEDNPAGAHERRQNDQQCRRHVHPR